MNDEMSHPATFDVAEWLRFDAATNPYGPSPKVREAMAAFARTGDFSRYSDEERAESLRGDLAAHWGLSPDHFIVYNGSGEAVVWLFLARLLLEQQRLLIPSPSYERFVALGQRCAAAVFPVPLHEENFALVPERFIEAGRQSGARVLLLSSPNNPTGNLLCGDVEMARLLDELPDCLCIVDEAYADYAGYSCVPWVQERENLVVLRTFSKAYGMAGLRIGYAIGPKPVIAAPEPDAGSLGGQCAVAGGGTGGAGRPELSAPGRRPDPQRLSGALRGAERAAVVAGLSERGEFLLGALRRGSGRSGCRRVWKSGGSARAGGKTRPALCG